MDGQAILDTLKKHGITLTIEGQAFRVSGGKLTRELRELVAHNKDIVAEAIRAGNSGHCGITQTHEPEPATKPEAPTPQPSAERAPQPVTSPEPAPWTEDQLWDLYKAIGDGAVLALNRQVPRVSKVHLENARAHIEVLMTLGPAAIMAACVAIYKEQVERRKTSGLETFVLRASLSLAAVYQDNTPKWPAWYEELLRKSDELRANRQVEIGHDRHVMEGEVVEGDVA
jgi:hypothetical protein